MKLKSLVTISTSYNRDLPDQWRVKLEEHVAAQESLASLKSFPKAFNIVTGALDKPLHSAPIYLWNYEMQADTEEEQLIKYPICTD
jgi:hypothetical protein